MRREFEGRHPLTADQVDNLWINSLIVVDTNVLLSLYRLSPEARRKLIDVLGQYSDRLWMPYQVGVEFHANRVEEIRNQQTMEEKLIGSLETFKTAFGKILQEYSLNVDIGLLGRKFDETIEFFSQQVRDAGKMHIQNYGITPQNDPVLLLLEGLFEKKVGSAPSEEWLVEAYSKAETRYEKKIPPGYKDAKTKEVPRRYGDYIIWSQIIEHARSEKRDVIFVTDDKKSDWWWESRGEILGPEPRLRDEFRAQTGQQFYSYRSSQFIRISDERQSLPVDENVVREIQTTGDAHASRKLEAESLLNEMILAENALSEAEERLEADQYAYHSLKDQLRGVALSVYNLHSEVDMCRGAQEELRRKISRQGETRDDTQRTQELGYKYDLLRADLAEKERLEKSLGEQLDDLALNIEDGRHYLTRRRMELDAKKESYDRFSKGV